MSGCSSGWLTLLGAWRVGEWTGDRQFFFLHLLGLDTNGHGHLHDLGEGEWG